MLRVTNLNLKLAVVFIPLAIKVIHMMMSVSNWFNVATIVTSGTSLAVFLPLYDMDH